MTSFNCFILALFVALMFFSIDVNLAARRLQQERKGIEGMVVGIMGIKGKLGSGGRVTFGALGKLRMLGSGGSEPGFSTVGIVG
ncbi:hypothetical protein V6N11_077593 [Hibiscus sabdariffa]|uniref:Uncharacterized protein n=1 Tax=Hibiscus sabdariffa TaxID=183260 RepID=A0ABR2TE58_9ROSI